MTRHRWRARSSSRTGRGCSSERCKEFSERAINLSKIESRPSREKLGTYIFLMDVDGHRTEEPLATALAAVKGQCSFFRVLGSYPKYRVPA